MRGRTILLIVIGLILVCALGILLLLGSLFFMFSEQQPTVAQDSFLELKLAGGIAELPAQDPFTLLLNPDATNLWDLRRIVHKATGDDRIRGMYLEVHPLLMSWAQVEEIRTLLQAFKLSGKPIHCLLAVDMAGETELYAASVADRLTLNPAAGLIVDGLVAEVTFMKRTMDKLGIKPQFLQLKEFKSPETETRTEMTPEFRQMYDSILSEMHVRFIATVAADRNIDPEKLSALVDLGMLPAQSALEAGLVDQLAYRADIRQELGELAGGHYTGISLKDYGKGIAADFSGGGPNRVAVVGASGLIIAGDSEPFAGVIGGSTVAKQLRQVRENSSIDGVIFRVNSPGGSAVGSDMVWREVRLLEEGGKPVVVSMSAVAGSGGYYIAMGAGDIVSQPSTITGSIGVIFGKYDLSGLYDWLGMDIDRIKTAPNADIFSLTASLTGEQRRQVLGWMEAIYSTFVQKAADGRGVSFDELEPKAHGKIYTGTQALEVGLIDHLGGYETAIAVMRERLQLEDDETLTLQLYPRPKTLWEVLASGDLFSTVQPANLTRLLTDSLQRLETPAPWLIGPEIRVH